MPKYMLLLHESPASAPDFSPEDMQAIVGRYKKWRDGLVARGVMAGGEKLVDGTGRVLKTAGGKLSISDGPFVETKELVGGFFVIDADGYDSAVELSRDCPHLEFGAIEIRQIDQV